MNTPDPNPNPLHEPDRGCVTDQPQQPRHSVSARTAPGQRSPQSDHTHTPTLTPPTPEPSASSDLPASTHHSSFIIHNSSLDTIITTVANFYRIPPSLARGACRDRKAAWPRQVAMALACEFFPHIPGTTISRAFRRAHSTLSYARQCVITAQKNPRTRADLTRLRKLIHQKLSSQFDDS